MSAQSVRFERLGAGSAMVYANLHAACFDAPWDEKSFASLLNLPGVTGLVGRRGSAAIALGLVRAVAGEAEILTLAVAPAARRRGVGAALVRHLIERAQTRGVETLHLEVSVANGAARALYAGLGFDEVGRRTGYYRDGTDAVVCRRVLGTPPN